MSQYDLVLSHSARLDEDSGEKTETGVHSKPLYNNIDADDDNDLINSTSNHSTSHSHFGKSSILKLLSTMDAYFEEPRRREDVPSLLSISDRYSIMGRGTVVAGILERGLLKKVNSGRSISARMHVDQGLKVWGLLWIRSD